jgi:DNA polymerase-3 subunit alpha
MFVHLHVHSQLSLLDGTASPEAIARRAADLGMKAVALTDSSNLFGAVAFFKACKGAGIKPILGAELDVQPEGIGHHDPLRQEGGYKVVALVEDDVGYKNLCALVTDAIFKGLSFKPRVDLDALFARREGLLFLTGGRRGAVGRRLERAGVDGAREDLLGLRDAVGPERLFVELVDQGLPGQDEVNRVGRQLATEVGLETVVSNAVHYLDPSDAPVHELLGAIAAGRSLADPERAIAPTDQASFKTEDEIRALFPDDADAVDRTATLAERCHFKFDFGTYHFPATTPPDVAADGTQPDTDANWAYFYRAFPPPRDFGMPDPTVEIPPRPDGAGCLDGYFGWYCRRGLELRLQHVDPARHAEYHERLEIEVSCIAKMGFPAYLLIVAEFINWSKDNEIPVGPGRGSAAGSLAAFAMRITDIDPILYDLVFERFLNPERVSMPDIDVDFCQDRREEAIAHVRQKYGADLVTQIVTYGTLKAKAAVRDVARALDMTFNEADRIAKLVPEALGTTLSEALDQVELLRVMRDTDPKVRRVIELALKVEGAVRQTGVHAAGVVVADRPLVEYAPLYRDADGGDPVVQYDMKSAEAIGLIKFDFLGLKTLDQIRDAIKTIERNHGVKVDMAHLPVDDEPTYQLLQKGDALGVFQLESEGMRNLLMRLRPSNIDDMVALVALYRPGPLSSGMTDDFVLRKHDASRIAYPLPVLEPILRSTYGTIVYQEQVMQIAQAMAGYSLGEADLLRRAMGKKKPEEMAKQQDRFVSGSVERGIPAEKAVEIFDLMAMFAAYGFNKSHSAAYGVISYQTAWLKAHYRAEYMAALMTIEAGNTDKILIYIDDCRRAGIRVAPVCVNQSQAAFDVPPAGQRPDGDVIRFGLSAVKNVGSSAVEAILEARRAAGGKFDDALHVFRVVDPKRVNRRVYENLIKAGAFDFAGVPRRALFEGLEAAMAAGQRAHEEELLGQTSLFGALAPAARPTAHRFPDVPEWGLSERLKAEHEVLGLYLTGHPMAAYARDIEKSASHRIAALSDAGDGEVKIIGLPGEVREMKTKRGDKMAFVRLDDVDGSVECVFFPQSWTRSMRAVQSGEALLVHGRVERKDDAVKVLADGALRVVEVRNTSVRYARVDLRTGDLTPARAEQLAALLKDASGRCETRVRVRGPGWEADFVLPDFPVEPTVQLQERAAALFGREDVVVLQ